MKSFRSIRSLVVTCTAVTLGASMAQAAVIATESFAYTPGALGGQGSAVNGWSGAWTGSPATVTSPGLTYTEGGNILGSAATGKAEGLDGSHFRNLTASAGGGTSTVYVSFIARSNDYGYWGLSLFDNGSENMFLGAPFEQTNWGFERAGGGGIAASTSPTNVQSFLVYRMDFSGGDVTTSLYVNPTLASEPGSAAITGTRPTFTFNRIRLEGGLGNSSIRAGELDEIRIGTTWADVTPASPIPEPASLAVLGMISGMALLRRSR
jgi:hypothetical protein